MSAPCGKLLELAVLLDSRLAASSKDVYSIGQTLFKAPASWTADLCKRDASMSSKLGYTLVSTVGARI